VHGEGYPVLLFAPGFLSSRVERWSTMQHARDFLIRHTP
jgi:hypothetical protein